MLLILFGLAGAGKNFVGNILAKQFGYYHWDADLILTPEIKEQISKQELFTQEMRDDLTQRIIDEITILKQRYQNIVISQALYKQKNRQQIALAYPNAKFVQVIATQENIINRLKQRNNAINTAYANKISNELEVLKSPDAIILNNTDTTSVICQLKNILLSE